MSVSAISLILKALDGLSARAGATAYNIANANSPGFRPVRVDFEAALAQAAGRGADALRASRPAMTQAETPGVRVDLEMATASETSARYGALVEVLNRQLQINALAVSGGR